MNGPFTRDASKLDSVAKAVLKMRGKVPSEQEQLDEAIVNPNSSGQGHDDTHVNHPLHSTITKHGYNYSHSTPIHKQDGTIYTHHTYARGEHKVGVNAHSHDWESKTSSASGHSKRGTGHEALDKHLKGKAKRYTYDEETQIEEDTKSPMHEDLTKAGYKHTDTTEWNGKAAHTYEGPRNHEEVLNKHGFKKAPVTDNRQVLYRNKDDHVTVKAGSGGNVRLTHHHNDPSYTYKEEAEQLDELSKKTLKSYKKQALGSSLDRLQRTRDSAYISGNQKGVANVDRKMKNRYYGHKAATEKLAKK